jgi:cobalt-zinc-cadmium efflux system outer membrane protein
LRNGFITPIDLLRTQLLSEQYDLQMLNLQRNFQNKLNDFRTYLNIQDSVKIVENSEVFLLPIPATIDSIISYALVNRSDLISLKELQAWNQKNVSLQKALKAPYFEAGGILNPQNGVTYAGTFATLSVPVFNRNQGEIKRSEVAVLQTSDMILYKENLIRNEVKNAYLSYQNNQIVVNKFQEIMKQSAQVLSTVKYSYLKGNTTIIDFLEAQRSFLDTQELYNNAMYDYKKSYLDILYVSGLINAIQ